MKKNTIHITDGKREADFPIEESSIGPGAVQIGKLPKALGCFSLDPGFVATASCRSKITYIDGARGLLRYRGYPIEELAEQSTYLESVYLLLHGELPNQEDLDAFAKSILESMPVPEGTWDVIQTFPRDSHPMAMLMAGLAYLSSHYHSELDVFNTEYQARMTRRLIAQIPTLAALGYRYRIGKDPIAPRPDLGYTENFLHMMFGEEPQEIVAHALDVVFLLHADHEQNASTSTVRMSGSSETSPVAALTAGVATLWGPAHGGANEAVIQMLESIYESGIPVREYLAHVKDKREHIRLMGFGHRVYKNYDPRARIIQKICHKVLATHGPDDPNRPLLETAMELERVALEDDYFVKRKLYPNVDFYSGIILRAIGIPVEMSTVIFVLARTSGWLSHWQEMMSDEEFRISRPRQLYTGFPKRAYQPMSERD